MAIETERRFLVDFEMLCDNLQNMYSGIAQDISQFYLNTDPECTIRVRSTVVEGLQASRLTVKGKRVNGSCPEIEFDIPNSKGDELAKLGTCYIGKKRFTHDVSICRLNIPDLKWEIDVFGGLLKGLVIAEVEVPDIKLPIDLPSWIGREITEDNMYSNSMLAMMSPEEIRELSYA
jgi:adenylate cyclase